MFYLVTIILLPILFIAFDPLQSQLEKARDLSHKRSRTLAVVANCFHTTRRNERACLLSGLLYFLLHTGM